MTKRTCVNSLYTRRHLFVIVFVEDELNGVDVDTNCHRLVIAITMRYFRLLTAVIFENENERLISQS